MAARGATSPAPHQVSVLASMATRGLLAELVAAWDGTATVESTGGVDAARRVRGGEAADVVVLAGAIMRALEAEGLLLPGSLTGVALSSVALAVRDDAPVPGLEDAGAVRQALLAAPRIGYSTGPSGDHLLQLVDRWGLSDTLGPRLVQAPPGVPVGRLLAEGTVDLAVQQRSELAGIPGIAIAGVLPPGAECVTMFTAGVTCACARPGAAAGFVRFLASPGAADAKRRHGMEPAA